MTEAEKFLRNMSINKELEEFFKKYGATDLHYMKNLKCYKARVNGKLINVNLNIEPIELIYFLKPDINLNNKYIEENFYKEVYSQKIRVHLSISKEYGINIVMRCLKTLNFISDEEEEAQEHLESYKDLINE